MPVITSTRRDSTHAKRLPPFAWPGSGSFPSGMPWASALSGVRWPKATASSGGTDPTSTAAGTVPPPAPSTPVVLPSPSSSSAAQSSNLPKIMVAVVLPLACLSIALGVLLFVFSRRKRHRRRVRLLQPTRPTDSGTTPYMIDALPLHTDGDRIPRESKYDELKAPPRAALNDGVTTPYIIEAIPVHGSRRAQDSKYDILKTSPEATSSLHASQDRCPLMLDELHRAIQRTGLSVQAFFSSFLTPRPDAPADASPPRYEA